MPGRSVVVALSAVTTGFTEGANKAAAASRNLAKDAQAAGAAVDGSMSKAAAATAKLAAAQNRAADAAGKARVAQLRLAETEKTATAGSAKQVAAQEKLASAQRKLAASEKTLASAAAEANAALNAPSAKASVFDKIDSKSASINKLSNGLGVAGLALAAGVGVAIKAAADFDEAMSGVAATGGDARASLDGLRAAAIKAGADTKFSATEAAQGEEALAKAGVSAKDVLGGGLTGALSLAAAGNQSVADSAETAASAMVQFGLSGKDVPHIADLLAQGAGTAKGEVSDMAAALNQSGLVAHQFGLSLEETTQSLALLAKAGTVGSDAGTSLKTMLLSLYAPSNAAAKQMKQLGVSAYDATGNLKPIGSVLDELKGRLDTLSAGDRNKAMRTIFGTDAIRAANALLQDGSAGLQQMATDFKVFGSAADVAATKMNNLKGDLEQFKGSVDTALIGLGEGGQGPLRDLTKSATNAVNSFTGLSQGAKDSFLTIGASVAVMALATAGLGKLAVGAAEARTAMLTLGITMKGVVATAAPIAAAFAAVEIGAHVLDHFAAKAKPVDALTASLQKVAAGSTDLSGLYSKGNWADSLEGALRGSLIGADDLGSALKTLDTASNGNGFEKFVFGLGQMQEQITPGTQALEKMRQQSGAVDEALTKLVASNPAQAAAAFQKIAAEANGYGVSTDHLLQLLPQYAAAAKAAGEASKTASTGIGHIGGKASAASASLADLVAAAHNASNAFLAMRGDQVGVEAAIDGANDALKTNGKTLDVTTAKGRANRTALDQIASATNAYTESLSKSGKSAVAVVHANERGRAAFIATAVAMGKSKEEAKALANSLFRVPKSIKAQVAVPGAKLSKKQADDVNTAIKNIPKEKRAKLVAIAQTGGIAAFNAALASVHDKTVTLTTINRQRQASGRGVTKGDGPNRAAGGPIYGPGSATSDSIPAWLSNGEFVIKAATVSKIGVANLARLNEAGHFAKGGAVGFAAGGSVDSAVLRYINAAENPLKDILKAEAAISKARRDERKADTHKERVKADHELAAAHAKLTAAEKTLADTARSVSDTFYDSFISKTDSVKDWIALMSEGTQDVAAFNAKILKLRKAGLSEALIQQIIARGAEVGGSIADQLLKGGKGMVDALDKANAGLQGAADKLGLTASTKPVRKHADGGYISGPGSSTSDSIRAYLSNGEYVVNAAATAANRGVLDAMNYSRPAPIERRAAYATGGYVQQPMIDVDALRAAVGPLVNIERLIGGDPHAVAAAIASTRRAEMTAAGMSIGN